MQWFSGTILTGVCGAALMGGAVFASLDGETNFAAVPERVENTLRGADRRDRRQLGTRKSDRLPPAGETSAARQVIRITTTTASATAKSCACARSCACPPTCRMASTEFAANVPPFNRAEAAGAAGADGAPADDAPAAEPDAEVSYVTRDLAAILPRVKIAARAADRRHHRARARHRQLDRAARQTAITVAGLPPPAARLLMPPTARRIPMPASKPASCPKTSRCCPRPPTRRPAATPGTSARSSVKKGDNIVAILRELGATPEEIAAIAGALGPRGRDNGLKEGQKLRILLSAGPAASGCSRSASS